MAQHVRRANGCLLVVDLEVVHKHLHAVLLAEDEACGFLALLEVQRELLPLACHTLHVAELRIDRILRVGNVLYGAAQAYITRRVVGKTRAELHEVDTIVGRCVENGSVEVRSIVVVCACAVEENHATGWVYLIRSPSCVCV